MTVYKGTTIYHTHGDTLFIQIGMTNPDGTEYEPEAGDVVRFILRADTARDPVLVRQVPLDTLVVQMSAAETKALGQGVVNGHYVYDLELTKANGVVDTFIRDADLYILKEA